MSDAAAIKDIAEAVLSSEPADLYRRITDASPVGIAVVDATNPEHPLVYANQEFCNLTGYPAGELLGRNLRFLQGEDREQDARHRLRESLERGEATRVLLRNYRKDGTLFWNELSLYPISDEDGAPRAAKTFVFWSPPTNAEGELRSPNVETARVVTGSKSPTTVSRLYWLARSPSTFSTSLELTVPSVDMASVTLRSSSSSRADQIGAPYSSPNTSSSTAARSVPLSSAARLSLIASAAAIRSGT